MSLNPTRKHKSHAFGKNIYYLGQGEDGTNYWLEAASWDCNWYWGFGYIESYTNNNCPSCARDIQSHEHFDGLDRGRNINLFDAFKERFVITPLSDREIWTLCELMRSFYTAREYADMVTRGGANYTENPCKNIIKNEDEATHVNQVVIPAICSQVYKLLSSDHKKEESE